MSKIKYESIDNKYAIIKNLGKGKYGKVFLVKENNNENKKYAAKILIKNTKSFEDKIQLINKITNLNNPYIIKIIASSKEGKIKIKDCYNKYETKQYAIYEYATKKTILKYLILPNPNILEEQYAKIMFKYILKGIQAMHNAGICHRDIKLENILLDDFFKPKICDFGFSKECKDEKMYNKCGTYEYCAPEILRKIGFQPYDGMKADIFSLGITLLNMVTGKKQDNTIIKFIQYKIDYNFKDYLNITKIEIKNLSPDLQKLIIKMLDFNPDKRPSIEEILNAPWMIGVKEDDLNQEKSLYEEFKKREDLIEENKITTIQSSEDEEEDSKDFKNYNNKSLKEDENEIFEQKFIMKNIKDNNKELIDYLNINGKLNPFEFMNFIMNKLNKEIKDGHIKANKNYYIIEVKYEYENEEDEGEDVDNNEEEEIIDYKYGIWKKDLFIQIILFESDNGNHILQFYKKTGETEDYYKKLETIISIIKKSIALYKGKK